ncbi:MAG: hypothetical protein WAU49_20945 [Steroidobacteraceae bacterium]
MSKDRVEGTFQNVAGMVQEAAGKARRIAGQAQSAYGEAVDQARDASATVRRSVKQQPLMALVIVACVGYALGWLTLRRRAG